MVYSKYLFISLGIVLVIASATYILTVREKKPESPIFTAGTSSFPKLDIVSGEISQASRDQIKNLLSISIGKDISDKDITIPKQSYKKTYNNTSEDYTIVFNAVIDTSTYLVTVTHTDNVESVGVDCAPIEQAICVMSEYGVDG